MSFKKSFNTLLNEVLTEYRNEFQGEITPGSVLYVKAACTASMLWGLYQSIDKCAAQMFVSTASREFKERHAAEFGISTVDKTDAEITAAVIAAKHSKMSGGNRYDYVAWAMDTRLDDEYIKHAQVIERPRGEGTFDIVVQGSESRGVASFEICQKIYDIVQERRPVGAGFSWGIRVLPAVPQIITVKIEVISNESFDKEAAQTAITTYINELNPREVLYKSQLLSITHQFGAVSADVIFSGNNVEPIEDRAAGTYSMIRVDDCEIVEEIK